MSTLALENAAAQMGLHGFANASVQTHQVACDCGAGRYKVLAARLPRVSLFQWFYNSVTALARRILRCISTVDNFFDSAVPTAAGQLQDAVTAQNSQAPTSTTNKSPASPLAEEYKNSCDASLQALQLAFGTDGNSLALIGEQLDVFRKSTDHQFSILAAQESGLAVELEEIQHQCVKIIVEDKKSEIDKTMKRLIESGRDSSVPLTQWQQFQKNHVLLKALLDYAYSNPISTDTTSP
jgi:hypothetical protein